jgi:FlaA1/EpsC-like NDP-sugar epimerase
LKSDTDIIFEELLGRSPSTVIPDNVQKYYDGKSILVTGAAGTIGSDVCKLLIACNVSQIVLFDQSESGLYDLYNDLKLLSKNCTIHTIVGNICFADELEHVFEKFKPQIVFHVAAYKHVPLMEAQPLVAIRVNVFGTKMVAEYSIKHEVDKFIFVSTDKALNPKSILGATKRIGELFIQKVQKSQSTCSFITCRFGNVFNSNGSVVPLFKKQIEFGGPITLTHAEVTRYFMSVVEASSFLLEAAAIGRSGDLLFFDMDKSVKILDLAQIMINYYGGEMKDQATVIKYIGLRPGEKLHEDSLNLNQEVNPTESPKIFKYKDPGVVGNDFMENLVELEAALKQGLSEELIPSILSMVPEYQANRLK